MSQRIKILPAAVFLHDYQGTFTVEYNHIFVLFLLKMPPT